jgi:hypothetical protein
MSLVKKNFCIVVADECISSLYDLAQGKKVNSIYGVEFQSDEAILVYLQRFESFVRCALAQLPDDDRFIVKFLRSISALRRKVKNKSRAKKRKVLRKRDGLTSMRRNFTMLQKHLWESKSYVVVICPREAALKAEVHGLLWPDVV